MATQIKTDADVLRFALRTVAEQGPKILATAREHREIKLTDAADDVIEEDGWEAAVEALIRLAERRRSESTHSDWDIWNARCYALVGVLAEKEGRS